MTSIINNDSHLIFFGLFFFTFFYKNDFEKFSLLSMVVIFALSIVSRANTAVLDVFDLTRPHPSLTWAWLIWVCIVFQGRHRG